MRAVQGKIFAVVESTLPRGIDVALVILLLRRLNPDTVGTLESCQAIAAPLMLLFLSPEQILYKDLSRWKADGSGTHLPRVRSLRHFCWMKGLGGVALAALLSLRSSGFDPTILCAFLWAFSRMLAPQVVGIDREYLRISGKTGAALTLALSQKAAFFIGAACAVFLFPQHALAGLAAVGTASVFISAVLGRVLTREAGESSGRGRRAGVSEILREAFTRFSFWSHVSYVSSVTIESLDVMALGTLGIAKRAVGIYGSAVRVANFSFAIPTAVNLWFGMRIGQASEKSPLRKSARAALSPTRWLLAVSALQTLGLCVLAPWIGRTLGASRWTALEQDQFAHYLPALALGSGLYTLTFALMTWLKLARDVRSLVLWVFMPWLAVSAALYFHFAAQGDLQGIAWANIACYGIYAALIGFFQVAGGRAMVPGTHP